MGGMRASRGRVDSQNVRHFQGSFSRVFLPLIGVHGSLFLGGLPPHNAIIYYIVF